MRRVRPGGNRSFLRLVTLPECGKLTDSSQKRYRRFEFHGFQQDIVRYRKLNLEKAMFFTDLLP